MRTIPTYHWVTEIQGFWLLSVKIQTTIKCDLSASELQPSWEKKLGKLLAEVGLFWVDSDGTAYPNLRIGTA